MMKDIFVECFDKIVLKYSETIAIENCGEPLSFSQLRLNALSFGSVLKGHGVKKGDVVALRMEKSTAYITSVLACWYLGAVILPIDTELPSERTEFILKDSEAKYVVGNELYSSMKHHCIEFELPPRYTSKTEVNLDDSAYIIYTSGSTGKPKGVKLSHSGLVVMLRDQIKAFGLQLGERSLFMLSISFDASLSDIGTALLSGATLVIEPPCRITADHLLKTIYDKKITYVDLPPSLLAYLNVKDKPDCLKTIVIGGDVCKPSIIREWASKVKLINVYGPTEATICTSLINCDTNWSDPLIGEPLTGVEYNISQNGELLIAGCYLAEAYINQPDLTKLKFVYEDGVRWYHTGDHVRLNGKGEYVFLGRLDRQVKLHGKLIALEEIESKLNELSYVEEASVIKYAGTNIERLVACVKTNEKNTGRIRSELRQSLPIWMIPTQIVFVKELARNTSNKIDVESLHSIVKSKSWDSQESLEDLFYSYVGEYFPLDADFFDQGIDSFGLIEISINALDLGLSISPSMIAECRTLETLKQSVSLDKLISKKSAVSLREDAYKEFLSLDLEKPHGELGATEKIMLTGARGYLGAEVLLELLKDLRVNVYCLLRCSTKEQGLESLLAGNLEFQEYRNRIIIIPGDISQENLGVEDDTYFHLLNIIDTVYHCAAEVNNLRSYEQLYSSNVTGVVEVLRFCTNGKVKKLNYASTLSVFVSSDQNSGILKEDDSLSGINYIYGGYSQTKFCAEIILQKANEYFPYIDIFRFGLITPPQTKTTKKNSDFLQMFIEETMLVACRPIGLSKILSVDITPVDFAAQAFVEIGKESMGAKHTWHIVNNSSLNIEDLYKEIERVRALDHIDISEWNKRIRESNSKGVSLLSLCRLRQDFEQFRTMDLFQASGVEFDSQESQKVLSRKQIDIPKITPGLIQKYIEESQCV